MASKDPEGKIIQDLANLLRKNGDRILSGESKLCLTTSSLGVLGNSFRRYSDVSGEDTGQGKSSKEVQQWRDNVHFLHDFVLKTFALKIIHGSYTMPAPIQLSRFRAVQVLEVKKVPIHMIEGLQKLRGQLKTIIVSRSLQTLRDLFETCGGDRSSAISWSHLKSAFLSFNGVTQLDESLRLLPVLDVLDLSHNDITHTLTYLEYFSSLSRLNLGFNRLESIPRFSFSNKGCLLTLVLRNNNLDTIEGIEELTGLEELDLSDNCLVSHDLLQGLVHLRRLKILCLSGNPLSYHNNHRLETLQHVAPVAYMGMLILDGKGVSSAEMLVRNLKRQYLRNIQTRTSLVSRSSSDRFEIITTPSSPGPVNGELSDSIDSSSLLVHSSSLKKKKRKPVKIGVDLKERVVDISDVDATFETSGSSKGNSEVPSPTGSYVEDPQERQQVVKEKDDIDTMRKYYGKHWLQAFTARQNNGDQGPTQDVNSAGMEEKSNKVDGVEVTLRPDTDRSVLNAVDRKSSRPQSMLIKPEEVDIALQNQTEKEVPTEEPVIEEEISPEVLAIYKQAPKEDKGSIYRQETLRGKEWTRSESQQEMYYGEESEPFIVMLPEEKMKHMFLTVNDRYIVEKELTGVVSERLDVKYLLSMEQSEQSIYDEGVGGYLNFPVIDLKFDYISKKKNRRVYAMEDESFAKNFEDLLKRHIEGRNLDSKLKDLLQCMKCSHQFYRNYGKPADFDSSCKGTAGQVCPKCGSNIIIGLNVQNVPDTPPTSLNVTPSSSYKQGSPGLSPRKNREGGSFPSSPQARSTPLIQRKKAIKHRECVEGEDTVDGPIDEVNSASLSTTSVPSIAIRQASEEGAKIPQNPSWPDFQQASARQPATARGSVSSVDSEICILTPSRSSVTVISESSAEKIAELASQVSNYNSSKEGLAEVANQDSPNKTDEVAKDSVGGLVMTPVGSPLSSSVCSSMVSSVYENSLSLNQDNSRTESSPQVITLGSSDESVTVTKENSESVLVEEENHNSSSSWRRSSRRRSRSRDRRAVMVESGEDLNSIYMSADSTDKSQNGDNTQYVTADNSLADSEPDVSSQDIPSIYDSRTTEDSKDESSIEFKHPELRRTSDFGIDRKANADLRRASDLGVTRRSSSPRSSNLNLRRGIYGYNSFIETSLDTTKRDGMNASVTPGEQVSVQDMSRTSTVTTSSINSANDVYPWESDNSAGEITDGATSQFNWIEKFKRIDHRLQLYLEFKVLEEGESCQCALECDVVQYFITDQFHAFLVISTNKFLILKVTGDPDSDSQFDWLTCIENQPITELQYIDIGLGYQSLRLEFGTDCSSYTFLLQDEERCKDFITLLTDIVKNQTFSEHSKLQGISKSNADTTHNLQSQVLAHTESADLVKYLMVQWSSQAADTRKETLSLVITTADIVLVRENCQWPLPRLQAPLSGDVKGQQFAIKQKEKINNIETVEYCDKNSKILRLKFFNEESDGNDVWFVTMETLQGVKSLVDSLRGPWEEAFGVTLDITPAEFTDS